MYDKHATARRIKALRGTLSQRAFAKKMNCGQVYVSEIETGRTKPSIEFLVMLSDNFHTTVDFVLRGGKMQRILHPKAVAARLEEISEELLQAANGSNGSNGH